MSFLQAAHLPILPWRVQEQVRRLLRPHRMPQLLEPPQSGSRQPDPVSALPDLSASGVCPRQALPVWLRQSSALVLRNGA